MVERLTQEFQQMETWKLASNGQSLQMELAFGQKYSETGLFKDFPVNTTKHLHSATIATIALSLDMSSTMDYILQQKRDMERLYHTSQ